MIPGDYSSIGHPNGAPSARQLDPEVAKLYIYDDLGVSQRWANKLSEVSIETVGDLVNHTEDDLLRIEGIGVKAIEELKAGLAERDPLYILEDNEMAEEPDTSQLLDMLFASEDSMYFGEEIPKSYSASPDDDEYTSMHTIRRMNDDAALDELLGDLDEYGTLNVSESQKRAAEAERAEDIGFDDIDDDFDIDAALSDLDEG